MTYTTIDNLEQVHHMHKLAEIIVNNATDLAAKLGEEENLPPEVIQGAIHNAGIMLAPRTKGTCFCIPREEVL